MILLVAGRFFFFFPFQLIVHSVMGDPSSSGMNIHVPKTYGLTGPGPPVFVAAVKFRSCVYLVYSSSAESISSKEKQSIRSSQASAYPKPQLTAPDLLHF
ncbi:hypothetical protein K456DRAFT_578733 [Colletotrichum gloeosporioides 23]|nr:hypothetical protein K456DRAFT_578733 [Colletotrichum gloeosporioides 23]